MNLESLLQHLLPGPMERGLLLRLRAGVSQKRSLPRILLEKNSELRNPSADEKIVVAGLGAASVAFLQQLHRLGFKNVEIVRPAGEAGGKCVNLGCMPAEFFMTHPNGSPCERLDRTRTFVSQLNRDIDAQIQSLGFPIRDGRIVEVRSKEAILEGGSRIAFDKLVLATGNRQSPPQTLSERLSPLESFWTPTGKTRILVSDSHPAALSLAELSVEMGLEVKLFFTRSILLGQLPSLQYFRRHIQSRGVEIMENASIEELPPADSFFFYGHSIPNRPKMEKDAEIDFRDGSLCGSPDVHVLGDSAGLFSASEAQFQAIALAERWAGYPVRSIPLLSSLPFRLHGSLSLSAVGSPASLLAKDWNEIDFRALSLSRITSQAGKLWYRLDSTRTKFDAIHICHPQSGELIAMASALRECPIDDPQWLAHSVHPSAAEIFHVMALDARARTRPRSRSPLPRASQEYSLPRPERLRSSEFFSAQFTEAEIRQAELDPDPPLFLGLVLGLRDTSLKNDALIWQEGRWKLKSGSPFEYKREGPLLEIEVPPRKIRVVLEA